jgi:antitoxin component of MazEF toxin-antitoxin module
LGQVDGFLFYYCSTSYSHNGVVGYLGQVQVTNNSIVTVQVTNNSIVTVQVTNNSIVTVQVTNNSILFYILQSQWSC